MNIFIGLTIVPLHVELNHTVIEMFTSFQQGDEKGFTWFFRELYPSLSLYAYKIIKDEKAGEEIASAAFIKIWEKREMFSDAVSIKKYLYRIVKNDSLKYIEKEKRKTRVSKEVVYLYGREEERNAFNSLVAAETASLLLKALNTLPMECGKVFRLLYLEEKSVQEAAKVLGLSPSTVKTQKARGLKTLRKTFYLPVFIAVVVTAWSFFPS